MGYVERALAYAKSKRFTPEDVARWDYGTTARAAGVVVLPNGDSPNDFFFLAIRMGVCATLWEEFDATRREAIRAAMKAGVNVLAGEADTDVTMEGDLFRVSSIGESGDRRAKP